MCIHVLQVLLTVKVCVAMLLVYNSSQYIPRDIRAYETSESEETGETESKNELWTCRTCNVTIQLRSKHCKVSRPNPLVMCVCVCV